MTSRVIDIGDVPVRMSVRGDLLVLRSGEKQETAIPPDEVGALIVSNPQASLTNAVLARLTAAGAALVFCDERHQPCGMVLPLAAHRTQAERFAAQAAATLPMKKQAWMQVAKAKILAQARLLKARRGTDGGLAAMAAKVRSGDPDNQEARAARKYWPLAFGPGFTRDTDGGGLNSWLNYGYAVLRAVVARAICGAGLHPSLGLHHHNRYDTFCLASDLMEPYRPLVDGCVAALRGVYGDRELDKEIKRDILAALAGEIRAGGQSRTLFSLAAQTASSLVEYYVGNRKRLFFPALPEGE
ncbi:MAG: type II CRISPR-associated endonuclease Cas1 [Thermodesulfobacteriota bacterium]